MSLILASLVLVGLFAATRQIERWLHQHLFKVGWLMTHNFQTTTILYYTIFLPGVFLHEMVTWLVAGALNVRAEGQIKMPDAQEIGELRLNFVKFSARISPLRRAVIRTSPLLVGLLVIWIIATNNLDIDAALGTMGSGELDAVTAGIGRLLSASDFWLWAYFIFAIGNTMFPNVPKDLQGWRSVWLGVAIATAFAVLLGIGNELFATISPHLATIIFTLQVLLLVIIGVDVVIVIVLAIIENTIERITGHSATFRKGKMIVMRREDILAERQREKERERSRQVQPQKQSDAAHITNVYQLRFSAPMVGDRAVDPNLPRLGRLLSGEDPQS